MLERAIKLQHELTMRQRAERERARGPKGGRRREKEGESKSEGGEGGRRRNGGMEGGREMPHFG